MSHVDPRDLARTPAASWALWLGRERIVAPPGFNRWLVPPAAMAMHLSIGMAYGFSVFWLPLMRLHGITESAPDDWSRSEVVLTFTLFFVFLGSSAAVFGHWLERVGPRLAGVVAALCWGGGLWLAGVGAYFHQIWLLWLGAGVIGGCGLGLGYISPVSTLIKWFPDRRGVATGMAIMGFGGGAMIGAPLADILMQWYSSPTSVGVWQTFFTMGTLYWLVMLAAAFAYRVPPTGWHPTGWRPELHRGRQIHSHYVHLDVAHRTPQFWLLWAVLCLNVSAGIGVLGVASPMIQEVFGGELIGVAAPVSELGKADLAQLATVAAAFTGLLSLFNIIGRFFWASASDFFGRKLTFSIFFICGAVLYALAPTAGDLGKIGLFVAIFCIILTMYGGGFATIPAYLADLFGTQYVGAIHGRLLTAWSTAGILGPMLLSVSLDRMEGMGFSKAAAYGTTLFLLAGLLLLGLLCNLAVRPVSERFLTPIAVKPLAEVPHGLVLSDAAPHWLPDRTTWPRVYLAWTVVLIPLAWGMWKTIEKSRHLFY